MPVIVAVKTNGEHHLSAAAPLVATEPAWQAARIVSRQPRSRQTVVFVTTCGQQSRWRTAVMAPVSAVVHRCQGRTRKNDLRVGSDEFRAEPLSNVQ
jgi:hypothetical protein